MRLLIVEDEEDMREALCYGLRRCGYAVDAAGDGADAVEQCGINEYDLVAVSYTHLDVYKRQALNLVRKCGLPQIRTCWSV